MAERYGKRLNQMLGCSSHAVPHYNGVGGFEHDRT